MRRSAFFILIAMLTAALTGRAATDLAPNQAPTSGPIGAGSDSGGWVALAYPDTRPPIPGSAEPRPPHQRLYYLPADAPPGALYSAMSLPGLPYAIAASGARVVLLFEPPASQSAEGSPRWTVRALTAFDQPDPLPPIFDPSGRLEVLPALRTDGEVVGFCGIPGGGVAALIRPVADATGRPIGGYHELTALIGGSWRQVTLPTPIPAEASCRLLSSAGGLMVLISDKADLSRAALWRVKLPRTSERNGSTIQPDWRREWITITDCSAPLIVPTGGHLLTASRTDAGAIRLTLHLAESKTILANLKGIPEQFAFTRVGDTAALVYLSDDPKPQIMTAVVHTSTGEILHQGAHVQVSPLTKDDLRFLGFVLALVLMTALVFVLRPAAASKVEVTLPAGTALASPERRLAAGLIDFAIPALVVVEMWGIGLSDVLLAPIRAQRADEFWPFAVASGSFFAHTVFSEWLFGGRTLGKAILRIRVASIIGGRGGDRVTIWQCVCRNTIKLVCPPLLIMIFVDPRRRHPGDTIAGAVVVVRARGPEPPADDDDNDGPGRTNEAPVSDG